MIKRIQHLLPLHAKLTLNNSHCLTMETQGGVTKKKDTFMGSSEQGSQGSA